VSLTWISDEKSLPFISPFITPLLTTIAIFAPGDASPMLPPILNRLSKLSPDSHLQKILIIELGSMRYCSIEEASSQLLMQCNHRLREFSVDSPISASALKHVRQLPSLERFQLVINSFDLPDPLPMFVFPSLQELSVKCKGVWDLTWLKLLPCIENPVLTIISVKCPSSDVERFMETFQLTTTGSAIRECLQSFTVHSPDYFKITPRIIACTFSFKNLTSLKLCFECTDLCQTSDLTDDDIDLLTNAMPCLKHLIIGGEPCGLPSQITFKSLYTISRRCVQLFVLIIHFNPAVFVTKVGTDSESWDVALGLSDLKTQSSDLCSINHLSVGNIPLPAQSNAFSIVALGLLGMFPRLEAIGYENPDWGKVNDLIGVFRRMGRFALGKG
jgi:hypothetical protein